MEKYPSPSKMRIETQDFSSMLAENRYIEWISQNGKILLYLFLGLIFLSILAYRLLAGSGSRSEADYLNAAHNMVLLQRQIAAGESETAQETLKRLTAIIHHHPELHAQYDGAIAQLLINQGLNEEAKSFALPTLDRLSQDGLPYYIDYAANTLLIGDKKFSESLEKAKELKDKILNSASSKDFSNILFVINLLRIGMLQQQLNQPEDE